MGTPCTETTTLRSAVPFGGGRVQFEPVVHRAHDPLLALRGVEHDGAVQLVGGVVDDLGETDVGGGEEGAVVGDDVVQIELQRRRRVGHVVEERIVQPNL